MPDIRKNLKFMGRSPFVIRRATYLVNVCDRGDGGLWAFVYNGPKLVDVILYRTFEEFLKDWRKPGTKCAKLDRKDIRNGTCDAGGHKGFGQDGIGFQKGATS